MGCNNSKPPNIPDDELEESKEEEEKEDSAIIEERREGQEAINRLRLKLKISESTRNVNKLGDMMESLDDMGNLHHSSSWRKVVHNGYAFRMDEEVFSETLKKLDQGEELTKDQLRAIYSHVDESLFDYIYDFIDWDQDGTTNLNEFVIAMTALFGTGLTMDEKVEILFTIWFLFVLRQEKIFTSFIPFLLIC